ncbi:hypothetical protein CXB49_17860 [Chromobacterium sp. ATCC 53434]|nr:hypothetical protein CXB49_17860 [Chromobacterium sp. ATCC 53434]
MIAGDFFYITDCGFHSAMQDFEPIREVNFIRKPQCITFYCLETECMSRILIYLSILVHLPD